MTFFPRLIAAPLLALTISAGGSAVADDALLTVHLPVAGNAPVVFDRGQLAALARTEFSTTTPWTEGTQHFVGVSGRDLVDALGVEAETVVAHALNSYEVTIPFEVFAAEGTLVAYSRNGEAMDVRGKGPLWIVFPFDTDPTFASDLYLAYSIWNLDSVRFE